MEARKGVPFWKFGAESGTSFEGVEGNIEVFHLGGVAVSGQGQAGHVFAFVLQDELRKVHNSLQKYTNICIFV